MARRRKRTGVLTRMRASGPSKPSQRTRPWWQRILAWIGGGIALTILAAFVVGIVWRVVAPGAGQRPGEGDFEIVTLVDHPLGFRPEERIVAKAVIIIDGKHVDVPIRADQREGVELGDTIHVRYTLIPNLRHYRVESWTLVSPAPSPPPPASEQAPEP